MESNENIPVPMMAIVLDKWCGDGNIGDYGVSRSGGGVDLDTGLA